jgi:hypothetical protein
MRVIATFFYTTIFALWLYYYLLLNQVRVKIQLSLTLIAHAHTLDQALDHDLGQC